MKLRGSTVLRHPIEHLRQNKFVEALRDNPKVTHPFGYHRLRRDIASGEREVEDGRFYSGANFFKSASVRADGLGLETIRDATGKSAADYYILTAERDAHKISDEVPDYEFSVKGLATVLRMAAAAVLRMDADRHIRLTEAANKLASGNWSRTDLLWNIRDLD